MVNTRMEGKVDILEKEKGELKGEVGVVKGILQELRESMATMERIGRLWRLTFQTNIAREWKKET